MSDEKRNDVSDPNPCETTRCFYIEQPLERCEKERCPFAWTRRAREDRERRDAKDLERKAGEPTVCVTADCIGMSNPIETCERTRCPFTPERRKSL